jgi:hypothetical protein
MENKLNVQHQLVGLEQEPVLELGLGLGLEVLEQMYHVPKVNMSMVQFVKVFK